MSTFKVLIFDKFLISWGYAAEKCLPKLGILSGKWFACMLWSVKSHGGLWEHFCSKFILYYFQALMVQQNYVRGKFLKSHLDSSHCQWWDRCTVSVFYVQISLSWPTLGALSPCQILATKVSISLKQAHHSNGSCTIIVSLLTLLGRQTSAVRAHRFEITHEAGIQLLQNRKSLNGLLAYIAYSYIKRCLQHTTREPYVTSTSVCIRASHRLRIILPPHSDDGNKVNVTENERRNWNMASHWVTLFSNLARTVAVFPIILRKHDRQCCAEFGCVN